MGKTAKEIVKTDVKHLLELLNTAYGEEWLAYYQYFLGAKLCSGQMRPDVQREFEEHAKEELEHANLLADRIIELGGTPLLSPDEWTTHAKCRYEAPKDEDTHILVCQNLASERCAIKRYQEICDLTFGNDYQTFHIARHILEEEIEHEQEMEDFLKDMHVIASCELK